MSNSKSCLSDKKVVAFVPAKGSSSRIESKNMKLLDGKPLFLHSLEKLVECDFIHEVYLDTESDEVIDLAKSVDCKILKRDPSLATNKVDGNQLFLNEVNHVKADVYIQHLCTSPFITKDTIKVGVEAVASGDYDSAVLVNKQHLYTWTDNSPDYDINNIPNSFTLDETIIETMGLYVMDRDCALQTQRRIGNRPFFLNATPIESVDVNWPDDFILANHIASGMREKRRRLFNNIKARINSAILSDLMDDMGLDGVVTSYQSNLSKTKIFGRAKTLRLRKIKDGESHEGIYNALKTYKTIIPGDVIVVENEISECAYFGELNANLAIRAGASGAVIGGVTRDSTAVSQLDFPVFSKGNVCRDVRKRAVMDHYNQEINFEGVQVAPGDLVFGDEDGLVFIPKKHEKELIKRVFNIFSKEKNILVDIANGVDEAELFSFHGEF
ncbi:MAG: cytidyltransferase [Desulfobacteraceae bacterium]|nr:cytidyltransferase [Desulfobacteraceae bacterium]